MPNFNFTYDPGTTLQQMIGFEIAGRVWSSYLTDNATINIHVGVSSDLPTNVIGGALPGMRAHESYQTVYNQLLLDKKSTDDQSAVRGLSWGPTNTAMFTQLDANGNPYSVKASTSTINLTRANAKALGMGFGSGFGTSPIGTTTDFIGNSTDLDGYILFSDLSKTSVHWNYDYTRLLPAGNTLDFLSTAIHEIGHVLGYVSGIDNPGWVTKTQDVLTTSGFPYGAGIPPSYGSDFYNFGVSQLVTYTTPLDLFRYSTTSTAAGFRDMSYGSQGGNKYFSTNQGQTAIAQFSTGANIDMGGDGQQASHWKPNTGMMSPTLALGQRTSITGIDLRAFDTMGWDLSSGGINISTASIALSTLSVQAGQSLASRAGQSLTWVLQNLMTSPTQLVQNRQAEIKKMAHNSQIYNLGDEDGDGFWQTIQNLFDEQGLFSTLDELEIPFEQTSISQIVSSMVAITDGQIIFNQAVQMVSTLETSAPKGFKTFQCICNYTHATGDGDIFPQKLSSGSEQPPLFSLVIHGIEQISVQVSGQGARSQSAIALSKDHNGLWQSEVTVKSKVAHSDAGKKMDVSSELDDPIVDQ